MIRKVMATGLLLASMTSGAAFAATPTPSQGHAPLTPAQMEQRFEAHFKPLLDSWNLSAADESAVWQTEREFHQSLPRHPRPVKGQPPARMTDAQRAQFRQALKTRHERLAKVLNQKQLKAWFVLTRPPMHRHPVMHKPVQK